jgi:hypothetical protein
MRAEKLGWNKTSLLMKEKVLADEAGPKQANDHQDY